MSKASSLALDACPFCVLDDPEVTVHSDALVQALVSRRPINRFHVIVVPRVHVERLPDLAWNGREELGHAARADVASAIRAQLSQST